MIKCFIFAHFFKFINYAQMVEADLYETSERPNNCKCNKRKKLIPFITFGTVLKMFQAKQMENVFNNFSKLMKF